jgi:hypothetical protein
VMRGRNNRRLNLIRLHCVHLWKHHNETLLYN